MSIDTQLSKLDCKEITAFVRGEKQQTHNHLNFGQASEMEAIIAKKSQIYGGKAGRLILPFKTSMKHKIQGKN